MTCCPHCAEEIPDGTTRCPCSGWPTWATVLLSALGGAAVAVVGAALLKRRASPPAPPAPIVPPPPAEPVEPPAPPRPRRSRRRAPAP